MFAERLDGETGRGDGDRRSSGDRGGGKGDLLPFKHPGRGRRRGRARAGAAAAARGRRSRYAEAPTGSERTLICKPRTADQTYQKKTTYKGLCPK